MIWSLEDDDNRCFVEALYGHESPITSMDTSRKERVLTSGGLDQSIRIWKIVEQAQTVFQSKHKSVDIARLIDDQTFVSGGEDGAINIWTTMKRAPLLVRPNAHGPELGARRKENENSPFSSNLRYWITSLATYPSQKAGKVRENKVRKKRRLERSSPDVVEHDVDEDDDGLSDEEEANCLSNQGNGTVALIASGSCDSKLRLWDLRKTEGKYELTEMETFDCPGYINEIRFTSDGTRIVAACGQEHRLGRWWKLDGTKNCLKIFEISNKKVN